jgi:aminoglycoside phosphotransferase (APT) family kinase protein
VAVWEPEIVVDEALARRLLAQIPQLAGESLRLLANGWDYTVWAVGEQHAFRFPRRAVVIAGTEREIAVLPKLAAALPLAVSAPVFIGRPTDEYPWPFFGSPLLPGREAAGLNEEARLEVASQLAGFLRTLHALDLDVELPVDVNGRADMNRRVPMTLELLDELQRLALWEEPPSARAFLDQARDLSPARLTSIVHGDLHFRQVLVDGARVTGVIDWVDVCRSDPAIDLSMAWSFLPPAGRELFLDAYGPVTDEQLVRARVLAFSLSAALAWNAHAEGLATVEREALAGLERAAE